MRKAWRSTHARPLLVPFVLLLIAAAPESAAAAIVSRGQPAVVKYASDSATQLTVAAPASAQPGDVLIAALSIGRTVDNPVPVVSAPTGWKLVTAAVNAGRMVHAVYWHPFSAGESGYTFSTTYAVGGVVSITAYGGVDTTNPVNAAAAKAYNGATSVAAPSVTTTVRNAMLIASYTGLTKGASDTWTPPPGMTEVVDANIAPRSAAVDVAVQAGAGASGNKNGKSAQALDRAAASLVALRPAAGLPPMTRPVPLIVDTDIFTSVDDVGALATAFGLQLRGDARVIAVTVNTRTSRPAVAVNSWRCVAAIDSFYRSPNVPIGTHMPADGTESLDALDYVGPCAALAPASVPTPDTAVNVYRRALAAQPDGSVVIASTGYLGNLADLLNSPPDAISPLSGRDLVAAKVRTLVVMGGGYPSRIYENNLTGDPAAAEYVSANWPGKLVWSGYEVGDAVHTGATISVTHPANSPVRVSYEAALRGPYNWYYAYDLTAVYHAVIPADPLLSEAGPGTNSIDTSGGNVFTSGPGSQFYLDLTDAAGLSSALEALLDTIPPPPSGTGNLNDNFDEGFVDPAVWGLTLSGSSVAVTSGELQVTHSGGSWTSGGVESLAPIDLTGRSVQVQVKRPANDARGGSTFGETSVLLQTDSTHYAEFFFAGAALTAWIDTGGSAVNLNPGWPAYSSTAMQWVRFREQDGTLFYEYAASDAGPWTVLAQTAYPFTSAAPRFRLKAGSNLASTDTARFDNVSTPAVATMSVRLAVRARKAARAHAAAVRAMRTSARHRPTVRRRKSRPACAGHWRGSRTSARAGRATLARDARCFAL